MKPTKQERAEAIIKCIMIACRHFKADPEAVFYGSPLRDNHAVMARAAVWTHMYQSGMSYEAIGKSFDGKSVSLVRGTNGLGKRFQFNFLDREMIATMPKLNVRDEVES